MLKLRCESDRRKQSAKRIISISEGSQAPEAEHGYCTLVSWDEGQPGNLVFYPKDSHIGIVGGWDESGNIQIIRCASGHNNAVITGRTEFVAVGRFADYGE